MDGMLWLWVGFNVFVLTMLALDLGVFHREAHEVSTREALTWSAVWIALAGVFNVLIYLFWGQLAPASLYTNSEAALAFLTGYLIEKSLSLDNIFVFVLIFSFFAVPPKFQHRVLFWGVLGALVMRGVMIALGAALLKEFHWIIYIFGAFLVFTGLRMAFHRSEEIDPESNPLVRGFRRLMPVTTEYDGDKFFVRRAGVLMATPLFIVLLMVETSDLIFAVDSIPAIFAVTQEPFLVYSANVFAILGLRSLYFVLADMIHRFHYLKLGLAVVLTFVGVKMLLMETAFKIPTPLSLVVILSVITLSVLVSLLRPQTAHEIETPVHPPRPLEADA